MSNGPLPEHVTALLIGHFQTLGIAAPDPNIVVLVDDPAAVLAHQHTDRGRSDRPWTTNLHLSTQA